jgi:hypothetical protein
MREAPSLGRPETLGAADELQVGLGLHVVDQSLAWKVDKDALFQITPLPLRMLGAVFPGI